MQGASWDGSAAILPQVPTVWSIVGSGDFNGDGSADILWQNTSTGERSIWFMNGNAYASAALLPQVPNAWSIAGVGDFNGDNKPDIVWQNTVTGERSIWFMNGATFSGAALLPQVPTVWSIAGVGDFNGDTKPDLVWQNSVTGERSIWFMNGAVLNGAALLPTVPTTWRIAAAGDFDGDSKPDLAWQNSTTGERSLWLMNGPTFVGAVILPTVPTQWSIAGMMASTNGCNAATSLQLAVGAVHTLTSGEKASLCVGGGASTSEYVLIPFNGTAVATSSVQLRISGANTVAIQPGGLARQVPVAGPRFQTQFAPLSSDVGFRERELRDVAPALAARRTSGSPLKRSRLSYLLGIPVTPVVGSTVQINPNVSGNSCSDAKQLTSATVVAVLTHTIVLSDTQSPAGGYTNAEMTAFGQAFDTLGYALDVANFGAESDADGNGRIAVLFTPSLNRISLPDGGIVVGTFAARDLFSVAECLASNEGEMFYVAVPDPNQTINGNFQNKTQISKTVLPTLVHEFQHLINAGRRLYVNDAPTFEEVWLNEALSHTAEELLYYRISGNSPRSNISLPLIQSSQAQLDAANLYVVDNLLDVGDYMQSPETTSPFSNIETVAMTGASWQLLRYASDRKGGSEQSTWSALVNTTLAGTANFINVFGDAIPITRDWAVAQYADDAGLPVSGNFTHPSWNYRVLTAALFGGTFPLLTHPLLGAPVDMTLSGAGAAYVRFGVGPNLPGRIGATSGGQPVPPAVDLMLLRTH